LVAVLEVVPKVSDDGETHTGNSPRLRPEDCFFYDCGLKNLAAFVIVAAVEDASKLQERRLDHQPFKGEHCPCRDCAETKLLAWLYSDRFELWCWAIDIDPMDIETRLCELIDG
jgi:hypothetical protein